MKATAQQIADVPTRNIRLSGVRAIQLPANLQTTSELDRLKEENRVLRVRYQELHNLINALYRELGFDR